MQLDIGEDTPGPDAYNADKATASSKIAMAAMDERERMPSSSFRSAGRKGTQVPQQDQPGPGAYSPNLEAVTEALPGANMRSNIIPKSSSMSHNLALGPPRHYVSAKPRPSGRERLLSAPARSRTGEWRKRRRRTLALLARRAARAHPIYAFLAFFGFSLSSSLGMFSETVTAPRARLRAHSTLSILCE